MPQTARPPSVEQFLIFTLIVQVAVAATLATMLVRFNSFRRILLTERRDWPERLFFASWWGVPLVAGVGARLLLHYDAADLSSHECMIGRRWRHTIRPAAWSAR